MSPRHELLRTLLQALTLVLATWVAFFGLDQARDESKELPKACNVSAPAKREDHLTDDLSGSDQHVP
jgi:hypothetical protein